MEIPITNASGVLVVDDEDADKALRFKWFLLHNGHPRSTTTTNNRRWPRGQYITLANLIMGNPPSGYEWDHVDRNKLNNRKSNFRVATRAQNSHNIAVRKNTVSGFKGVSRTRYGTWNARIVANGVKRIHIGSFKTKEEAAKAYDKKAREFFGEFAYTNF
jgi:hypothetical protein